MALDALKNILETRGVQTRPLLPVSHGPAQLGHGNRFMEHGGGTHACVSANFTPTRGWPACAETCFGVAHGPCGFVSIIVSSLGEFYTDKSSAGSAESKQFSKWSSDRGRGHGARGLRGFVLSKLHLNRSKFTADRGAR